MGDGHCFISYSTHDGLDFTRKLRDELEGGDPSHSVWYDKADLTPSYEWDSQIVEEIKACKCLLFLITEDSTKPASNCKTELVFALRYKKPLIPLLIQRGAEQPFLLGTREWIDFTEDFDSGMAKLRKFLRELELPEGKLRESEFRLGDAEHALRRAKGDEEQRIKVEIEELNAEIKRQKEIVKNPKKAEEQTQKNIETGLERERKPETDSKKKEPFTKFINPPPGIAPTYFQDRYFETEQVADFLKDASQRLMTIVGRAGVGKTTTICRLLKDLERGVLPDDLGEMQVDGIVYLSEAGSHKINFANIFYDLCKLLPTEVTEKLDTLYKNPQGSTESKIQALLDHFQGKPVVLLLDNFEPLVEEIENLPIKDSELDEALHALLNGTHTTVKVLITTRVPPQALNRIQPGRQRVHHLEAGLEPKYAKEMLRQMDKDGVLGFKKADEATFTRIYERTRGFPKALEALFQILASDRYTKLEELLAMPTPENVVEALVGEAFNRLDPSAQKVMQALAVYNRPVSPAAIDYLLQPHLPSIDSALVLNRLVNMHFARREAGRYYLHPADKEYAFSIIPEKDLTTPPKEQGQADTKVAKEEPIRFNTLPKYQDLFKSSRSLRASRLTKAFTQHDLLNRAADYFVQARKPRAEWKKLDDLAAQLAEFDLRCSAGAYDIACSVLRSIDFDYLLIWGHYRLTTDLHLRLKDKIKDNNLQMSNFNGLGLAHQLIGKVKDANNFFYRGLNIAREAKDRGWEDSFLGNLAGGYFDLGEPQKTIEFSEQQLAIVREIGNRNHEGGVLGNLGLAYLAFGDAHKAIEFYEQALDIAREIGNKNSESNILNGLGNAFNKFGDIKKSIEYYKQVLEISKDIGARGKEGMALSNIASEYANLGETKKAIQYYHEALQNAREIGNKYGESKRMNGLAELFIDRDELQNAITYSQESLRIGQEMSSPEVCIESVLALGKAYLFQNDLVNARVTIEAALQHDVPENNHNATTLHGIIALRQGERETAQGAFTKSIAQADEILAKTPEYYSALDAKGLALCGLILCRGAVPAPDDAPTNNTGRGDPAPTINDAIETFRKARKIAPHAGVVKSVLRLFDELVKCEGGEVLKDVRNAVEGK